MGMVFQFQCFKRESIVGPYCHNIRVVRFTYNEDNNVSMAVNESASQRRGSEYFS